ncbi:unnamed protein product, partial [Mesorhabditis spiculigera]
MAHEDEDWFHGLLPREDLAILLRNPGDYLLRISQVKPTEERKLILSLAYINDKKTTLGHYIIVKEKDPPNHYTIDNTLKGETVPNTLLVTPVTRAPWELRHEHVKTETKLGEGAFGDVYSGKLKMHDGAEIEVAIKLAHSQAMDKEKIKELMKEARLMRNFAHPNVVRIYGVAVLREPVMIVMELVDGNALDKFLKLNGDKLERVDKLAMILWLSPETLTTFIFTRRSDVWAYGVLIWEIYANGEEPYPGVSVAATKQMVLSGQRPVFPEGTPPEVVSLVTADIWEVNVEKRITMTAIALKLEALTQRGPPDQQNSVRKCAATPANGPLHPAHPVPHQQVRQAPTKFIPERISRRSGRAKKNASGSGHRHK